MNQTDELERLQLALRGRFSLEREIGRGGMGIVVLARDVALDRPVAIKLLPTTLAEQPDAKARFLREARTAAALSHPNIVPIHLVEETDGLVYFVMSYVDGESLGARVRRAGPLTVPEVARLVQEVAWALGYAHARGVIHRDIKPDNILIDGGSGRAMVTDFGIARRTTTATMSQQGEILGTLQYMSPEQASADAAVDGRADLYSLGVTAFFALTGRLPFDSPNPAALVAMHVAEPAPPVLSVRAGLPAKLAEAVDRCLAKDPAARFASGEALAEAIAEAQATRKDIAPSVRAFLQSARTGVLQLSALGIMTLWVLGWVANWPTLVPTDAIMWLIGVLAGLAGIAPIFAARGVVRAGFGERDVAEAAAALVLARDENIERDLREIERLRKAAETPWGRAVCIGVGAWIFSLLAGEARDWTGGFSLERLLEYLSHASVLLQLVIMGVPMTIVLAIGIRPGYVIGVLAGGPERAELLRKLWNGPIGRLLFRIAGLGVRKSAALPAPEAAPTEVLLGRAAGELFDQLSKSQRAQLAQVPAVIKRLESTAVALRARRDDLAKAIADVGEPGGGARRAALLAELEAARRLAQERLAAAVTALENLRLDLVRMKAGVGRPDDLTASLEQAQQVGREVDAQLEAEGLVRS